jgi:acyl carrier protein
MSTQDNNILDVVITTIRHTINEDWIVDFPIDAGTRFNSDLEIESIEFVKIADAIQRHFGARLDIVGWLSGKNIHELIALSVGELADHVSAALREAA